MTKILEVKKGEFANGWELLAEINRGFLDNEECDKETILKDIRMYEFLAKCDTTDLCRLVDSSAFNDIIKGQIEWFIKHSSIDDDMKQVALYELFRYHLPEAKKVLKAYMDDDCEIN